MRGKNFTGSNTHIFGLVYPWIILLMIILLDYLKVIDILSIPGKHVIGYFIGIITIPVLVAVWWFFKKNY